MWRFPSATQLAGQVGDAERVLVGLGGQAGEEVELHAGPALAVGRFDRAVQVLLGDELVDDGTKPPRARLRRERQTRTPRLRATWAATPTVKASTRNDGRLTLVGPHRPVSSTVSATTRSIPEKSAVDSEVRLTSS